MGEVMTYITLGVLAVLLLVVMMFALPLYNVWAQEQNGRAELAHADYSKQVAVQIAKAKADAAEYEANAEVTRARGVAQANQIIGDSLKNNEAYLRYLYINGIISDPSTKQIIYVPTEAGMPILEAGRTATTG